MFLRSDTVIPGMKAHGSTHGWLQLGDKNHPDSQLAYADEDHHDLLPALGREVFRQSSLHS